MALIDLPLPELSRETPEEVLRFLAEADRRIQRFQQDAHVPGFVPSDFLEVYHVLQGLAESDLAEGSLFCEWGSGFGVVACLAAMLDFEACGIEIEGDLVGEAQQLAEDFGLPVQFLRGSFIPQGGEVYSQKAEGFVWFTPEADNVYEELGLEPCDFHVIFAYPWPDEAEVTGQIFHRFAGDGALLLTYAGSDEFTLRRKKAKKTRGR